MFTIVKKNGGYHVIKDGGTILVGKTYNEARAKADKKFGVTY